MNEETRKIRVHVYAFTTARIDYEPVEVEVPADCEDDEAYEYAVEQINTDELVEDGTQTFEDKSLEFEYEFEDM